MASRCFCPPESVAGCRPSNPSSLNLPEHALDAPHHLLALDPEVLGPEGHLQGHVRREELGLEVLEDEPDLLGELPDLPLPRRAPPDAHLSLHPAPEEVGDQGR